MHLENMKKGLWGYRKEAVFQYIAEQEETFSQKLLEKDEQAEAAIRQARELAESVQQENQDLRRELEEFRRQQKHMAEAIVDARAYADTLRAETRAREDAARETVRQTLEGALAELEDYRRKIAALRCALQTTVRELERQAGAMEQRAEALLAESPAAALDLQPKRGEGAAPERGPAE